MNLQEPRLRQRGRASVDFLATILKPASKVIDQVYGQMADAGITPDVLPDDVEARYTVIDSAIAESNAYGTYKLLGDWHSRVHGPIAVEAFEEIEPELRAVMSEAEQGQARLTLDPGLKPPAYWDGVWFHRTTNAWDGYANMGYVHGEIIHKKMVARLMPGGMFAQRRAVAEMAPRDDYARILDMGCSSGHFTTMLAEVYPHAKITGVDLSRTMLEHACRVANANGWDWDLYQRPAEATGFADGNFDLVASYILLHELPVEAVNSVFAEAFRVLAPGGDMIMSDVTRYADLDKLAQWKADRAAKYGGEPHWRASASLDLAKIARNAGFVEVQAKGVYPHVVMGRKPA